MTQKLTVARIDSLTPRIDRVTGKTRAKDVTDGSGTGLLVRVQPSGRKYYYVQFRRPAHVKKRKSGEVRYEINTTRVRLGRTDHIGLNRARVLAKEAANAARGAVSAGLTGDDVRQVVNQQLLRLDKTPAEITAKSEHQRQCPTIGDFIDDSYGPYKKVESKYCADGREIGRLKHVMAILGYQSKRNLKLDFLGRKIYVIDGGLIRSWLTARLSTRTRRTKNTPSRVTVSRELNMMRAMFKHAVDCRWIESNPLDGITLKANSSRRIDPLTSDEEDRLLTALKRREEKLRRDGAAEFTSGEFADILRPIVLLAMHTGMRFGEIASLTWENVSVGSTGKQNQLWLPITKNNESHAIPLNDFVTTVLRKWRNQCAQIDPTALVFQDRYGKRLRDIRRFWNPVFQDAGLPRGYRFHDLRHHFASKLVMSGVPLFAVQSLLNHSSPQMTQRYAKFAPEWMEQTVGKLSEGTKWTL